MNDLPLNALRAFAAVHRCGGVRAAARELDIAHSSVSRHLAELEDWLGASLTEKEPGRSGLTFTAQGALLAQAVTSGLIEIQRAVSSARKMKSVHSVTISTTPSLATRWLLPRLPHLEKELPHLQVSVLVDQRFVDLDSGEIDLGIRMGGGNWSGVESRPLMDERLYPVMSPALWRESGCPNTPESLLGLALIHDRDPNADWSAWRERFGPGELNVEHGPRLGSSDLVLRAALLGQGVALARHRLAQEEIAAGLLMRPLGELCIELGPSYWLTFSKRVPLRPAARAFAAWLEAKARWEQRAE